MSENFWALIGRARPDEHDPALHAAAITEYLVDAGPEATVEFARAFDRAEDALYHWDLWGVAYLALGGCGDDGFRDLRAWLIGQGEATWALARDDPERLFLALLDGWDDPGARWEDLRLREGEILLYAAGHAHERITGASLPPRDSPAPTEPAGEAWEEHELPGRCPELAAALPQGWWDGDEAASEPAEASARRELEALIRRGMEAFHRGDHAAAAAILEPLLDSAEQWRQVKEMWHRGTDVAYAVGMGRFFAGDPDGASSALRRVESDAAMLDAGHVRRGLAQVELARGELDEAARHLDDSPEAARWDRVLVAKVAWRRGDHAEALHRARAEMASPRAPDEHPWDVAGAVQQLGRIAAEAGDTDAAEHALRAVAPLLADAPAELPLHIHQRLLEASVTRLRRAPEAALAALDSLRESVQGQELAEWRRERARAMTAAGRPQEAADEYERSVAQFERVGERWEARATREEAASDR